jgi:leucine dehydrogenase
MEKAKSLARVCGMTDLIKQSPEEFIEFLKQEKIQRFYFVYDFDKKKVIPSHDTLQPWADLFQKDQRDYKKHEGIFFELMPNRDVLLGAFVHQTNRGQAQGGTRFWFYDTMEEFFRDGLRLSLGMTLKNSLAGLWWGGGKGVILRNESIDAKDPQIRAEVFQAYGKFVSSLNGCYITAEDVGTTTEDMQNIFLKNRFTTCIPQELGGSGNPSEATAFGVVRAMEAAVQFIDSSTLAGKTIAIQGMGHVGEAMIRFLFEKNVKAIIATDLNSEQVEKVKRRFTGKNLEAFVTPKGDLSIFRQSCDILAPCAVGGILNSQTIPLIQARIVCGAANNQLEDPLRDDLSLFKKGVWYIPDFLVNRMGIVNCANEQYGYVDDDPMIAKQLGTEWEHSIYQKTLQVLTRAEEKQEAPGYSALRLAEEYSKELHPIFGHRGIQIIESLMKKHWAS